MHDTIDERLAQLGGSLEAAADVQPPTLVRSRGEQIRGVHRRRMLAMAATSAAVAVLGAGSLAFRGGGGHQGGAVARVSGTSTAPTTASEPVVAPRSSATKLSGAATTESAKPVAVVDVKQETMTVYDKHGQIVKTVAVTAGKPEDPSPVGVYTVTAKPRQLHITDGAYSTTVDWVIELNTGGPSLFLYAMPWADGRFGRDNVTHGEIGMSTESAQWLYNYVAVGDRIQIR